MTDELSSEAVQEWIDSSGTTCGECGEESFDVLDTSYEPMYEDAFGTVSPHRTTIKCTSCENETQNSLMESVVETIRG